MRLSVQLFTLRDPLQSDLFGTLKAVRQIGLEYVETAGLLDRSAPEWKAMLDELGLKVSGAHTMLEKLETDLPSVVRECEALTNDLVIVPWVPEARYRQSWAEFGREMNELGRRLKQHGLRLGYHNHSFEFKPQSGRPGLDLFYESSAPTFVEAQLDVAWVKHGGEDPAQYIRKLGSRATTVHLKDISDDPEHLDIEAGHGRIDWDSVLAACEGAGTRFGAIELDQPPGPPLESVEACYRFFASKGLR